MSVALFRGKRADGSFDFHGAFGIQTVNQSDYQKEYANCQRENGSCAILANHHGNDIIHKLKDKAYIE